MSLAKGDDIKGTLQNDPVEVPDLRARQIVDVHEKNIFDYIHRYPDKRQEGNITGEILEKQEKGAKHTAVPTHNVTARCDPE